LVVVAEAVPELVQLPLHLLVDRVANLRTVERHPRHAVLLADEKRLEVGHRSCHSMRPRWKVFCPPSMFSTVVPSEPSVETWASASRLDCSWAIQTARRVPWIANGGAEAMARAIHIARSSSCSPGTTS